MHVCLLIDLLTLLALIRGLLAPRRPARRLLCLGCLVYLLATGMHYYLILAPWFSLFERHPSMAVVGFTAVADFFGGFWTFFGVMVLAKGVSWIALAFLLYGVSSWLAGGREAMPQIPVVPGPRPESERSN